MAEHPRIALEVALGDRSMDPTEQEFDLLVSGRTAHYEGVVEIPLARIEYVFVASPEYVCLYGEPASPSDLAEHRCLMLRPAGKTWHSIHPEARFMSTSFPGCWWTTGIPVPDSWFKAYVPRRVERLERVHCLCDRLREALIALPRARIRAPARSPAVEPDFFELIQLEAQTGVGRVSLISPARATRSCATC